jgi:hypothetical protein
MSTAKLERPDGPVLVTFGDSWTTGEYLPGWQEYPLVLSELSWTKILSIVLNKKLMNMARGGNGNRQILHSILDFDRVYGFRPGDIVVISWSFAVREILLDPSYECQYIRTRELLDKYELTDFYEVHSMNDLEIRTREYVHYAELFLQSKNVKYKMAQSERWFERNSNWHIYNDEDLMLFEQIDYAADNSHPGIESNKLFFQKVYKELNA